MVKAYLRYEPLASFGVINSTSSTICYDDSGKWAVTPALEDVIVWDLRRGVEVNRWHEFGNKAAVTSLAKSANGKDFAVGYSDGTIRIWNMTTHTSTVTLSGHRSAVTALAFDQSGTRLASGAKDTDVIVWDVVAEAGLYRLKGHKDQITCLKFLANPDTGSDSANEGYLLSSSKDTLLKLWDLAAQFCRETLVAHRSEVWSFDINKEQSLILSGGAEPTVKAWKIHWDVLDLPLDDLTAINKPVDDNMDIDTDKDEKAKSSAMTPASLKKAITFYGDLPRHSTQRITTIQFHPSGRCLGVQANDRSVEIYRIRTHDDIVKKLHRRRKRAKEKGKQIDDTSDEIKLEDEISSQVIIRTPARVSCFTFSPVQQLEKSGHVEILVALTNNTIEVYHAPYHIDKKAQEHSEVVKASSLDLPGHRSDVRTLTLNSDDDMLASTSQDLLKLWNVKTRQCIRTMECGYAICSAFVPGDRHVLLGTKTGELELYDIGSAQLIQSVKAHEGAIYSLAIRPDKRGFTTGSADKDVKFWDFDLVETNKGSTLSFTHMRTLKMSDEVLCVRYSPNQSLLAVSLLDTTVKVFYHDTLKFFLSLYGHKLPVMDMDISSDNALIATCSADKNVKLWGLDFGDCHKSLFAHQDSIMSIRFVWGTHYFFTVSKDKTVKYWDGDKFENIMKLEGHHGEVWTLAVAKHGAFVVTGSHDRSIRIWEKTDEQLFLEEEREKELEELYETTLVSQMEKTGVEDMEVDAAGIQTMETLKAGERIMEAIDLADEERKGWEAYEESKAKGLPGVPPPRNTILVAMGDIAPERYVLDTIQKIRANDLEEALLVLPFSKVMSLFYYIDVWAKKNWNIILVSRILFILVKTHHNQIVANRLIRPMLESIRFHLRSQLQRQKDIMGYNRAALGYLQRDWKAKNTSEFMDDAPEAADDDKKRKFVQLTA
ncbi:Utp12-domain-containing protein [Hesseltinella vesiculosa]|uniref:Utp12-domain-containing protein n=1 Tax=Hesseltinella vesiculosa TaxID=101127 RepID=A0A1X2GF86_9FUNG|nr:Utp12-domain-containing protein [Hesseltinella vesiculosa]